MNRIYIMSGRLTAHPFIIYPEGELIMKKTDRFQVIYTQGTLTATKVLVDTETGVQYLYHQDGYAGGLTALLGKDGKPVILPTDKQVQ